MVRRSSLIEKEDEIELIFSKEHKRESQREKSKKISFAEGLTSRKDLKESSQSYYNNSDNEEDMRHLKSFKALISEKTFPKNLKIL